MKKLLLLSLLLLTSISCSSINPFITIEAQTLPITKTLFWNQGDLITAFINDFTVQQDTTSQVHVDPTTCQQVSPFLCSTSVTIATLGQHTFTVIAYNAFAQSVPATLTINVVQPGKSSNLKIQ